MVVMSRLATLALIAVSTLTTAVYAQNSAPSTVQGYAAKCGLYIFDGNPVVKVNLYDTAEDAKKSAVSMARPKLDVVLDSGPGYQVANLFKGSKVKAICENMALALKADLPLEIKMNADRVLESVTIGGVTAISDAFVLKSKEDQDLIRDLVRAYLAKDEELGHVQAELEVLKK